jgi:hypothetical protein
MALFGDTMTEVVTPDGRRITMPQQLAQSFPGLQPAPPIGPPPGAPQATELPAIPDFAPQSPPAPTSQVPPIADAPAAPVTSPAQVAPDGPTAPRGPVTAPQPGPDVQGANTPGPVTEAQLAKMGTAGAANAEMAAQDATREATRRQGEALADQATTIGNEMAAANDEAARLLAERKAAADAHAAALQAETDKYLRNAKAIADTKIDRKADHPVLAALSIALSGIGAAMAGDGSRNPALDMFFKAIDRKVAGQLQDLDQKRAGLATQKEGLGLMRQAGMDKLAEMDTYRYGYLEQAKRQVETIKQQTQSDVVRANADVALAGIEQEKAKTLSTAVDRFQTRQEQKEARAQQERHHKDSMALQIQAQAIAERRLDQEREAAAEAARVKGDAAKAKLIQDRALGGEVSVVRDKDGNPVLDKDGNPQVKTGLITDSKGEVWIPNGPEAVISTLHKQHNATNALVGTLDEIRKLGPEWLLDTANSDKFQRLQQLMGNATLLAIQAKELGVPTGRDIEFAQKVIGTTDPTRWKDSIAGLNEARKTLIRDHNVRLRTAGLDKDWTVADTGKKGSREMPGDAELKTMQRRPTAQDWRSTLGSDPNASPRTFKGEQREGGSPAARKWVAEHGEITPLQVRMIDQHGSALKAENPEARRKAGAWLEQVAKTGGTEAIRSYASQMLTNAVSTYAGESQPTVTGDVTGQAVARETAPQIRRPTAPQPKQRRDSAGNPY